MSPGLTADEGTIFTITAPDGKVTKCDLAEVKSRLEDVALERCDILQRRCNALERRIECLEGLREEES